MLLIISNSTDATADYLCGRLIESGVPFRRFDSDTDMTRVRIAYDRGEATLKYDGDVWPATQFSHVWYRRPEPLNLALEMEAAERAQTLSEWSEALEGFLGHIPMTAWMNHPALNVCASHKMEQLSRAVRFGLNVPRTLISQDPDRVCRFWEECDGRVVVKPLGDGYLERAKRSQDTHLYANRVTPAHLERISLVANCPALFQQEQDKAFDVRICVVDDTVIAAGLRADDGEGRQRLDIRRNNMDDVRYHPIEIDSGMRDAILRLVRSYGLRFSAIDMAVTAAGEWVFFEVNPNGQWAWLDLAGGFDIAQAFIMSFSRP